MLVFINEQEVGSLSVDGATVGEVIAALSVHVPIDHVVTEIDLDGERFRGGGDEGYTRRPSRGVRRLHLRTQGPDDLARELLDEVAGALAVVTAKLDRVVELFQAREPRSAQSLLAEMVEELHLALILEERIGTLAGGQSELPIEEFEKVGARLVSCQERGANEETARLLAGELRPLLSDAAERLADLSSSRK